MAARLHAASVGEGNSVLVMQSIGMVSLTVCVCVCVLLYRPAFQPTY